MNQNSKREIVAVLQRRGHLPLHSGKQGHLPGRDTITHYPEGVSSQIPVGAKADHSS